jgi:two-component system response regulator AtoC
VRLGGSSPIPVNIRIIAATNRNLEEMVTWGKFRQDLFFRLNVAHLLLPPLRDHREDIPLYVNHFARKSRTSVGSFVDSISEEAMAWFSSREWEGNVRELENSIIGALANCAGNRLEVSHIRKCAEGNPARERGKGSALSGLFARTEPGADVRERELLRVALEENHWNLGVTAKALGISRRTLYTKMQKFGLR